MQNAADEIREIRRLIKTTKSRKAIDALGRAQQELTAELNRQRGYREWESKQPDTTLVDANGIPVAIPKCIQGFAHGDEWQPLLIDKAIYLIRGFKQDKLFEGKTGYAYCWVSMPNGKYVRLSVTLRRMIHTKREKLNVSADYYVHPSESFGYLHLHIGKENKTYAKHIEQCVELLEKGVNAK